MASVGLPDGVLVTARSFGSPRTRLPPDFGVYLCARRPRDSAAAVDALREAHQRAARGERVEIACGSGRSRTGTALAALAVRTGLEADEAVTWVRHNYPPASVITRRQRQWLTSVTAALRRI